MNRRFISFATAAAMALATSTAPACAQGWYRGGGGWHGGGGGWHHHGGGGIGTGAAVALGLGAFFLGSALASAPYYNNYYSNSYPYNYSCTITAPRPTGIMAIQATVTPPDKRIARVR
jgi:hypothetical protein